MASIKKFEFEIELKSSVDAFWKTMKDTNVIYPKLFPEVYKSIEILEGDGKSSGTVRLTTFFHDTYGLGKTQKVKTEYVDEEKKAIKYVVVEGLPLKLYKYYEESISLKPKGKGCVVVWTCNYEKLSEELHGPEYSKNTILELFHKLDHYTLSIS